MLRAKYEMRNFINLITEGTIHFSYEQDGFPHALYDENDVKRAVDREYLDPNSPVTVYRGEDRPYVAKASEVPEIAKHFPAPAEMPPVRLSAEIDGFPTEIDSHNIAKLIDNGSITPTTFITVFRDKETRPTLTRASHVPEIASHFKAGPKEKPRVHITHALEAISGADITTEEGAHHVFNALHRICDTVAEFVRGKGDIETTTLKAVGEARSYFPRDVHNLMTNPHALRNIRDGLKVIADELKHYGVVMESAKKNRAAASTRPPRGSYRP